MPLKVEKLYSNRAGHWHLSIYRSTFQAFYQHPSIASRTRHFVIHRTKATHPSHHVQPLAALQALCSPPPSHPPHTVISCNPFPFSNTLCALSFIPFLSTFPLPPYFSSPGPIKYTPPVSLYTSLISSPIHSITSCSSSVAPAAFTTYPAGRSSAALVWMPMTIAWAMAGWERRVSSMARGKMVRPGTKNLLVYSGRVTKRETIKYSPPIFIISFSLPVICQFPSSS